VRIEGTQRALALTVDCNSRYCRLDPYLGAVLAVVEAARNLVAVGAQPLAVSDCLNYGNPERPDVMWEFQQGIQGIRDACIAFGTPVVSGNVSFYNETEGRSIPPTPTIAMVGLLDDVEMHVTPWWKAEGDVIVLLGRTREELGASEYLSVVHGIVRGAPPWIDLDAEKRLHRFCLEAVRERVFRSLHDVGEGGLAVALAECSFGGPGLGAHVELEQGIPPGRAPLRREPVADARVAQAPAPRPSPRHGAPGRRAVHRARRGTRPEPRHRRRGRRCVGRRARAVAARARATARRLTAGILARRPPLQ
jgi:phosphoribosylformylglycinamidine synthase